MSIIDNTKTYIKHKFNEDINREEISYLQRVFNLKKRKLWEREDEKGFERTDFKKFVSQVVSRARAKIGDDETITHETIKRETKGFTETRLYFSTAEYYHRDILSKIESERGLKQKMYRKGATFAFEKSSFEKDVSEVMENGNYKESKGYYVFGAVRVREWNIIDPNKKPSHITILEIDYGDGNVFYIQLKNN